MRRTNRCGNFFMVLLINMMLNLDGLIPAAILIALHFFFDISIWWGIGAVITWVLYLLVWMLIFKWVRTSSSASDKPKENKNPYSSGPYVGRFEQKNDK